MSVLQKITEIENEMARTQKNKATNYHLGLLKAKLAKLRAQLIDGGSGKGGGGAGDGFDVSKTGDARVGLIGFPSVGKSTLLTKLTGAYSEVAAYEFTTLTCVPGIFKYKGAKVQLLDLPGIIEGAKDGKGRGKQVIAVARTCGLILIILDCMKPLVHKRIIEKELEGFGGISITHTVPLRHIDEETIKSVCHEYRIANATFAIRCDATVDDVIDCIEGNRIYVPALYVLNKIDQITIEELDILSKVPHYVPVSAHHEWNLDGLIEKIWEYLNLTRVYTKPKGFLRWAARQARTRAVFDRLLDSSKFRNVEVFLTDCQPETWVDWVLLFVFFRDKSRTIPLPVILKRDSSKIEDFCLRIHKHLLEEFKYALVWGTSVKFTAQKVGKEHQLADEDVVQIIKKT